MDNRLKLNLHTHTARCNHAAGEEREYVENAIEAGIKILGVADHTPQPFPGGHISRMRMRMSEIEDYTKTVNSLKREYKGQIEILLLRLYVLCFPSA